MPNVLGRIERQLEIENSDLRGHAPFRKDLAQAVQPQLAQARQRVDDVQNRAKGAIRHCLALRREQLGGLVGQLSGVSPAATLERGYAVVRRRDTQAVVRSVEQVAAGDALDVRVTDGNIGTDVTAVRSVGKGGSNV